MDRKTYLLSSLKKQVLNLKTQLDQMDQHKNIERTHNRSTTESCRFNSSVYDSSYLDRGVKKFPMQENCKNIADLIQEKSKVEKVPKICSFRKAEIEKTKQNFSIEKQSLSTDRKYSPNPLTGQGYSDQKKGKKTSFPERPQKTQRKQTQRKHFNYSFK